MLERSKIFCSLPRPLHCREGVRGQWTPFPHPSALRPSVLVPSALDPLHPHYGGVGDRVTYVIPQLAILGDIKVPANNKTVTLQYCTAKMH